MDNFLDVHVDVAFEQHDKLVVVGAVVVLAASNLRSVEGLFGNRQRYLPNYFYFSKMWRWRTLELVYIGHLKRENGQRWKYKRMFEMQF